MGASMKLRTWAGGTAPWSMFFRVTLGWLRHFWIQVKDPNWVERWIAGRFSVVLEDNHGRVVVTGKLSTVVNQHRTYKVPMDYEINPALYRSIELRFDGEKVFSFSFLPRR